MGKSSVLEGHADPEDVVLVDFWAEWCTPCKTATPILREISESSGIPLLEVDVENNSGAAKTYKVMSIPTVILFKGGKEVKRIVGAKSKQIYLQELTPEV